MTYKLYKLQSEALGLLTDVASLASRPPMPIAKARAVMVRLLEARFGDIARIGATLEAVSTLKRDADDREVDDLRRHLAEHVRDEVRSQVVRGGVVGQSVCVDQVQVFRNGNVIDIAFHGALHDVLLLQLFLLTRFVSRGQLKECDCSRLFVKFGKVKDGCSPTCRKRVQMRRQRANDTKGVSIGKTTRTR